jgi:hypothetical protein
MNTTLLQRRGSQRGHVVQVKVQKHETRRKAAQ